MRSFIAIELDPSIRDRLMRLIGEFKRSESSIRWVKPQGIHLTLKFLGEVEPDRIPDVGDALERAAAGVSTFPLRVGGIGTFPPGSRSPRVIWAGITPPPALEILHSEIEIELEKLGFPKEKRRFHPHLTLGRVKSAAGIGAHLAMLEKHRSAFFGESRVRDIVLFRSRLLPEGAEYSRLREVRLQ